MLSVSEQNSSRIVVAAFFVRPRAFRGRTQIDLEDRCRWDARKVAIAPPVLLGCLGFAAMDWFSRPLWWRVMTSGT